VAYKYQENTGLFKNKKEQHSMIKKHGMLLRY